MVLQHFLRVYCKSRKREEKIQKYEKGKKKFRNMKKGRRNSEI